MSARPRRRAAAHCSISVTRLAMRSKTSRATEPICMARRSRLDCARPPGCLRNSATLVRVTWDAWNGWSRLTSLPTRLRVPLRYSELHAAMTRDKKTRAGGLRFVVLRETRRSGDAGRNPGGAGRGELPRGRRRLIRIADLAARTDSICARARAFGVNRSRNRNRYSALRDVRHRRRHRS